MALTEQQKNNISKLSVEDSLELMYELKERLGIVPQKEYIQIIDYPYSRQNLDREMRDGKIKHFKIGTRRYPFIND